MAMRKRQTDRHRETETDRKTDTVRGTNTDTKSAWEKKEAGSPVYALSCTQSRLSLFSVYLTVCHHNISDLLHLNYPSRTLRYTSLLWPRSPVDPLKSVDIRPPLRKPLECKHPGCKSRQIPSMGKKYSTSVARDLVLAPSVKFCPICLVAP